MPRLNNFPSTCTMKILNDFWENHDELRRRMKDAPKSWTVEALAFWMGKGKNELEEIPIIAFTGSSRQLGNFSPHALATWLQEQGETVTSTGWVKSKRHDNKIQAYYWKLSAKFRKKLEKAKPKKIVPKPWNPYNYW